MMESNDDSVDDADDDADADDGNLTPQGSQAFRNVFITVLAISSLGSNSPINHA